MTDTNSTAAAATAEADPELASLAHTLSNANLSTQPTTADDDDANSTWPTLSRRGAAGGTSFKIPEGLKRMLANMYDPVTNPDGIINAGIADNSLCRSELLHYFLAKDRLKLSHADLTYADRFTTSTRLLEAISDLFNQRQPDWPDNTASPLPLTKVVPDHIAIASGATGILDELFWNICDVGDGVLLSAPYYNAFDNDLTNRAKAQIVEVSIPLPEEGGSENLELSSFAKQTVDAYEQAYQKATAQGITVRALLLCNPHNPTGTIYPRETVVELAKLAGKYKLHFVSDEIYARSCFATREVPQPSLFHSILSIDTANECALDPAYVHVVTSASKDFAVNGFRLGVLVSQHNPALQRAMSAIGLLSQSASPAASLWCTWLRDAPFLEWYLQENRRRLAKAYEHALAFFQHYGIPYYPSNAGFFLLINLRRYAGIEPGMADTDARAKEAQLVERLIEGGVLISPGTMYHHPKPGWFRFTFSQEPSTLKLALRRLEKVMRVRDPESFEASRDVLDLAQGGAKVPGSEGADASAKGWFKKLVG
ncbi:hypothetical protein EX895_002710 [Sporisorium graminicola]|uniref:Aminotransferase class I/classII large domain-containing protein n=1 Tax=Sporisorium graminicola TaxID=280036 RepID=A0A4U7KY64_9BASI|nr:hypothetical protein EX895_002710 [Sporisorium graminicola]TKY88358.1 hypothetical protein EX895_002710 [Sporisorium graminicola]